MRHITRLVRQISRPTATGLAFLLWLPAALTAQSGSHPHLVPDSQVVTPGERYAASGLRAFMAGKAYRDLWTTPVKVEVADLATLGGGLTPLRRGGGDQTKVLHVVGADGKRYVFRSVEKFASQGIPEMVRGTPYESVLQDRVASLHPTAALIVGPLLEAANVLHVQPRLVVIPDDPRLGEFRDDFAGMLATFEERPDEGPNNGPGFAGADRIVGSQRLFERIESNGAHRVNAQALLSARLMDILLGDRDRSIDNWWWARFTAPWGFEWYPIPRDRDQAFIRLDGFLKVILGFYEPEIEAVGVNYTSSDIVGLTRSAWDLDRRFLVELERTTWDSVAHELQAKLTDSVIDAAVARMPPEHYALIGQQLASSLKDRRDRLPEAATEFYKIVTQYADVHGTNEAEQAVITRLANGDVDVSLYRLAVVGDAGEIPYFSRVFRRSETREIRVYLHGGADGVSVVGRAQNSIPLRIVGGEGPDILVDSSRTTTTTWFYDSTDTQFTRGPNTIVSYQAATPPVAWSDSAPQHPDWGSRWSKAPSVNIHPDLGLYTVLGVTHTRYGFLKEPYSSRIKMRAGYATGPNGILLDFRQDFRDVFRHVHPSVHAQLSEIEIVNFFGFGNDTPKPPSRDFFKLQQKQLLFAPALTFSNGGPFQFTIGPVVKRAIADTTRTANFLAQAQPYGSGGFTQYGMQSSFAIDTRDRAAAASRGVLLQGGGSVWAAWGDVVRGAFGEIHGELSTYLSPSTSGNQTLALRIGAKKVFGTAPFFESAFLGGRYDVRGFHEQRFAGDASLFGNAELRLFITQFSWLVPGDFGVLGMTDVGRVFLAGESSNTWHAGFGGGIWIAPFRRENTLTATVAHTSEQRLRFYFGAGFLY